MTGSTPFVIRVKVTFTNWCPSPGFSYMLIKRETEKRKEKGGGVFSTGNISSCSSLFVVAVVGRMLIPPCAQACTANLSAAVQAIDTDTLQFTVCDLFRINMSQVAFNPSSNQCSLQCQTSNHIVPTMKRAGRCIKIKLQNVFWGSEGLRQIQWALFPIITTGAGLIVPLFSQHDHRHRRDSKEPPRSICLGIMRRGLYDQGTVTQHVLSTKEIWPACCFYWSFCWRI